MAEVQDKSHPLGERTAVRQLGQADRHPAPRPDVNARLRTAGAPRSPVENQPVCLGFDFGFGFGFGLSPSVSALVGRSDPGAPVVTGE